MLTHVNSSHLVYKDGQIVYMSYCFCANTRQIQVKATFDFTEHDEHVCFIESQILLKGRMGLNLDSSNVEGSTYQASDVIKG